MQARWTFRRVRGHGKIAAAALMLFLWLFTTAMAVVPALHEWFHTGAHDPNHQCAVTALLQGKLVSADADVAHATPVQPVAMAQPDFVSVLLPAISHRPDFGRAPPAAFSSLV